jgi:hypothetical protein
VRIIGCVESLYFPGPLRKLTSSCQYFPKIESGCSTSVCGWFGVRFVVESNCSAGEGSCRLRLVGLSVSSVVG